MQRQPNFRVLAAGIKDLVLSSVQIDDAGTSALVMGTVETWSRFKFMNPDGPWIQSEPHNSISFTMELSYVEHRWMVHRFDWEFVPGTKP